MKEIIDYIITWLCYGDAEAAKRVAYTDDERALETHDVIIVPNGLLGKQLVVPELKKPEFEQPAKGKTIIRTDTLEQFMAVNQGRDLRRQNEVRRVE